MVRTFLWEPRTFMCSISWRNCCFPSSPAVSEKKNLKSKSSKWTSNHMHKNWSSNEMALSRQGESVAVRPWFWQCLMSQASESSTVMYGHLATRITRHQREPPRHQVRLSRHHQLATTQSRQHPAAKYFWHYLQKQFQVPVTHFTI